MGARPRIVAAIELTMLAVPFRIIKPEAGLAVFTRCGGLAGE
jgi:hypothetical protein